MITTNQASLNIENPDTDSITNKTPLNINYNTLEVSASGYSGSVKFNGNDITILNDVEPVVNSNMYYTPLFKENLSYDVWKTTINKTFNQLGNL